MSETVRPRRRDRSLAARDTGASFAQLPRLQNRWPPLEIFSAAQVARLIEASFTLLETGGMEIRSALARAV